MATLERLISAVRRELGPKRIWLTSTATRRARLIPGSAYRGSAGRSTSRSGPSRLKAPYVDMLINFMYWDDAPDEVRSGGEWLYSAREAKPSLRAFTLPFAQISRTGRGRRSGVRCGRARSPAHRLQELRNGGWRWLAALADPAERNVPARGSGAVGLPLARLVSARRSPQPRAHRALTSVTGASVLHGKSIQWSVRRQTYSQRTMDGDFS